MNYFASVALILTVITFATCTPKKSGVAKNTFVSDSNAIQQSGTVSRSVKGPGSKFAEPLPEADHDTTVYPFNILRRHGEVLRIDPILHDTLQLSHTKGHIDSFFLSPTHKYLACLRRIPGGEYPEYPWHELLVYEIPSYKFIRRLNSSEFKLSPFVGSVGIWHWVSSSRLLFTSMSDLDVAGYYVYDAFRDSVQEVSNHYLRNPK